MSNCSLIIGESGSGKSTSLRNLNPSEAFIINVLDKPLPFKGYKKKYSKEFKNYISVDNSERIINIIKSINDKAPHIKTIIIDDFQYVMANEFMRRSSEKGFNKFTEIGFHAWDIIMNLNGTRDDLYSFILSHSDTDSDGIVRCKTIGKMLNNTVTLEGMFTTIFHSRIIDNQYKFMTQGDGTYISKSPMDMFDDVLIDNDLHEIQKKIITYYED